ncbi:gustatory receptor for sugar taste 64a-like [Phlebotomus argentipes]|uniref:gustatory receptor for sugar taste 64a-like n=1 Tax=Phlebotomus argentipes TaxID=94469 RepID=UPI002892D600|nr:gustatory receptor for sugar taste 64a-like [Phlebotomus argentipes]
MKIDRKKIAKAHIQNSRDTFQRAVMPFLLLSQFFGLLPVTGVTAKDPEKISFSWLQLKTINTLSHIFFAILLLFFYMKHISSIGITAKNFIAFGFYTTCFISYIFFLWLAMKWKDIMTFWVERENTFLKYPYKTARISVVTHLRFLGFFLLGLALIEHSLAIANGAYNIMQEASFCQYNFTTFSDKTAYFYLKYYSHIFTIIPYNMPLALVLLWMNFSLTYAWNFIDIFTILVAVGVAKRFEQINNRLQLVKEKAVPEQYWLQIRLHYVQVCEIVEYVEDYLSPIILLSSANDFYFICYQLLHVSNVLPYQMNYVYFWSSLLYLIFRTFCLFLFTAEINDQSKRPLEILKTIPSFSWCEELERFIHQTCRESICFSGMKFFSFTRHLVLSMVGSVITYELVLMQVDHNSESKALRVSQVNSTLPPIACDFSFELYGF